MRWLKDFYTRYRVYFQVDLLLYVFMILFIIILFGGWGLGWWG